MTYFSYKEILLGSVAFTLCGFLVAFFKICMQILFQSNRAFLSMAVRLYKGRNRILHIEKSALFYNQGRSCGFFVDFFTVFFLFALYILISYICFDGIYRIVFLFLIYISYRVADAIFGDAVYRATVFAFNLVFSFYEIIFSVILFFGNKAFCVIIYPILLIIVYIRRVFVKLLEPRRKNAFIKTLKMDFNRIWHIAELS